MRIGIIGIGGIGGYFGARLLNRHPEGGEHQVVFVQRGPHLEAIKNNGLRYLTRDHEYLVRPSLATDDPSPAGQLDLAVLCVKSYDLEPTLGSLAGCLGPDSVLLTTMNGVDIGTRCRKALPGLKVLPGCIYISAHVERPGVVRQVGGAGNFHFGPEEEDIERFRWIERLLTDCGIKADLTGDIKTKLWEKYLFVCSLATVTSACGKTIGEIVSDDDLKAEWTCLMEEILTLAGREGVALPASAIDECLKRAGAIPPETKTSMQVDIEKEKRTEIDVFAGHVIKRAGELGLEVPCHTKMYPKLSGKVSSKPSQKREGNRHGEQHHYHSG